MLRRINKLWPLSWLLVLPLVGALSVWAFRTQDMYRDLALRNLGDNRLGGLTLQQAGSLQLRYLLNSARLGIQSAIGNPATGHLPAVHVFMQTSDMARLDEARPGSGQNYVDARLFNVDEFDKVKVRYRGDFAVHWGFFKRSLRVKTKRSDLFYGLRRVNLIAPKASFLYSNHVGYELAHLVGMMAPRSAMVALYVNGEYRGIHLLVEQISETLLRDQYRLPGDIYSGEQLYGLDVWYGLDRQLFESAGLWRKTAINNHYPPEHNAPLKALIRAVRSGDQQVLRTLIDYEAFAQFSLWEQLSLSRHIDNMHNWRLYFDPGRGRFYPILWDGMPWWNNWLPPDWKTDWTPPQQARNSKLMQVLFEDEQFLEVRNSVVKAFVASGGPKAVREMVTHLNQYLAPTLEWEPEILDAKNRWVTPAESQQRMKDNELLVDLILDQLVLETTIDQNLETDATSDPSTEEALIWSGDILIEEDLVVSSPLIIRAGTAVRLGEGVNLTIRGKLLVDGTQENPVSIEGVGNQGFGGIIIEGRKANGSSLNWLSISGGSGWKTEMRNYSGMLSIHEVEDLRLTHCSLSANRDFDDQLHVVYSSIYISDCTFEDAAFDAIDLDMSEATIVNSQFNSNGNDGLDLMGSQVIAEGLIFRNNADKGISVGERSVLDIGNSQFTGNQVAIQIKDDSLVSGHHLGFAGNQKSLDAYAKNWRYGSGGFGVFCGMMPNEPRPDFTQGKHSSIQFAETCPVVTSLPEHEKERVKQKIRESKDG